jgi:hypothetical protein
VVEHSPRYPKVEGEENGEQRSTMGTHGLTSSNFLPWTNTLAYFVIKERFNEIGWRV